MSVDTVTAATPGQTEPDQTLPGEGADAAGREAFAETLRRIRDAPGGYDLDFLREMPVKDALKWLTDLPGVGVKTASLVLLFNYARPVFPVDTHVHRVSSRVGVIPRMGEQAAHRALLALQGPGAGAGPTAAAVASFSITTGALRAAERSCAASCWRPTARRPPAPS